MPLHRSIDTKNIGVNQTNKMDMNYPTAADLITIVQQQHTAEVDSYNPLEDYLIQALDPISRVVLHHIAFLQRFVDIYLLSKLGLDFRSDSSY